MTEADVRGPEPSHVVVIGAGWAGWGAAKALCQAGVRVTLIDGMADPTGREPPKTASGKPFEAGTRGFWKDYPNINQLTTFSTFKVMVFISITIILDYIIIMNKVNTSNLFKPF